MTVHVMPPGSLQLASVSSLPPAPYLLRRQCPSRLPASPRTALCCNLRRILGFWRCAAGLCFCSLSGAYSSTGCRVPTGLRLAASLWLAASLRLAANCCRTARFPSPAAGVCLRRSCLAYLCHPALSCWLLQGCRRPGWLLSSCCLCCGLPPVPLCQGGVDQGSHLLLQRGC